MSARDCAVVLAAGPLLGAAGVARAAPAAADAGAERGRSRRADGGGARRPGRGARRRSDPPRASSRSARRARAGEPAGRRSSWGRSRCSTARRASRTWATGEIAPRVHAGHRRLRAGRGRGAAGRGHLPRPARRGADARARRRSRSRSPASSPTSRSRRSRTAAPPVTVMEREPLARLHRGRPAGRGAGRAAHLARSCAGCARAAASAPARRRARRTRWRWRSSTAWAPTASWRTPTTARSTSRSSEIIREYLGGRFGFDSLELTTDELIAELRAPAPGRELVLGEIEGWLSACDLVKFAKISPTAARGARRAGDARSGSSTATRPRRRAAPARRGRRCHGGGRQCLSRHARAPAPRGAIPYGADRGRVRAAGGRLLLRCCATSRASASRTRARWR